MSPETVQGEKKNQHQAYVRTEREHNDMVDLQQVRNAKVILEPRHEVCILGADTHSLQRVNIVQHESLLHQEDEAGQHLSWLLWH